MSGPPPGGIGTSRRMGFVGYCAAALELRSAEIRTRNAGRTASAPSQAVAGFADAVQIHLPHGEVFLAGRDDGVFHVQLFGETLDCAPTRVGMLDVRLFVQLEEFEIVPGEFEQIPPALPLQAEP